MPTIGVVGLGLMGASFALALKKARPELTIVGFDRDAATALKAMDRGIASAAGTDLDAIDMADAIVVAVPILAMQEVFKGLRTHVAGKVVTDVASTKGSVMEWAAGAGIDLVGGHPMCGRETSGIDAADADLFAGAPWILTRRDETVIGLVEAAGAHPLVMDAATHDRLVAGVRHGAGLRSGEYVLARSGRADWAEASKVAASGFRDMSRLAAGDPAMSAGITRTNRDNLLEQLDAISHSLARLRRHLEADDPRLVELFEEARSVRERWSADVASSRPTPRPSPRRGEGDASSRPTPRPSPRRGEGESP